MSSGSQFKRTQYARMGVDFSVLFGSKFFKTSVSGHQPILQEPVGVSTEGGAQATQHIQLRPEEPGRPTLTIGSVNVVQKSAMLRTYDCLQQMHRARYGRMPFYIDLQQYQEFLEGCSNFLQQQNMALSWESQAPVDRTSHVPVEKRSNAMAWVLVVLLVLGIAGGVVGYLYSRGML